MCDFDISDRQSQSRQSFDYASLDAETSDFLQQQTGEIRVLMKRTAQGIVEIGIKLISVKARLGHGRFRDWLSAEFEWSLQTAKRFMNVAEVFQKQQIVDFIAPSALYLLAAPSTPELARDEALARAEFGETITYTKAKAIKQKYAEPTSLKHKPEPKPKPEREPVSPPKQTPTSAPQPRSKLGIVAIPPQTQAGVESDPRPLALQLSQPGSAPEGSRVWWRLGGRHLLYCGYPNSDEFTARIPEQVQLLLAFPPARIWHSRITASRSIILPDYLPIFQNRHQLDEVLETIIMSNSHVGDLVVTCFLPFPDIGSIINRLDRQGIFAESNSRRCSSIVAECQKVGLIAEQSA